MGGEGMIEVLQKRQRIGIKGVKKVIKEKEKWVK